MKNKLNFIEYPDNNGDVKEIVCKGHVDLNLFNKKAFEKYGKSPYKTRHIFRIYKWVKSGKIKGKRKRGFNTHVECKQETRGSEPVTIGYYL